MSQVVHVLSTPDTQEACDPNKTSKVTLNRQHVFNQALLLPTMNKLEAQAWSGEGTE